MQTMEKNRLNIMPKSISSSIKSIVTALKNQIANIDEKLIQLIEQCSGYKETSDIIQSMPGMGKVCAATLIIYLPELGIMSKKQVVSLVSVAPMNKESGRYQGKRRIQGGRAQVRTVLYMAMMSAIQCNPVFKQEYNQLLDSGKPKKIALIACVRKMVAILNSIVRDGEKWEANMA